MQNKGKLANTIFFLSLLCIFVICSGLVISYQISGYQHIIQQNEITSNQGTVMSYLRNKIRFADQESMITILKKENTDILKLTQNEAVTYLYVYDHQLRELYADPNYEFTLEEGEVINPLDDLTMSINNNTLYLSLNFNDKVQEIVIPLNSYRG